MNDHRVARLAVDTAHQLGMKTIERERPVSAAEDFSYFIEQVPGAMCFIGVKV